MINRMLCGLAALFGALVMALGLAVGTASAEEAGHLPVAPWVANGQSEVVDSTTVKLQDHVNGDTSVENPSVGLNVQAGAVISVEYELMDGATCGTGEPRLFAVINGLPASDNWSTLCNGAGDPATSGVLSFQASSSGLVERVGMVYSRDTGHVIMRNLKVDGTLVLFQAPASPSPSPDTPPASPSPDTPPASPSPDPSPSPSTEPTETASPDPSASPSPEAATLPQTSGVRLLPALLIGGFALIGAGAGIYYATRRKMDPTL